MTQTAEQRPVLAPVSARPAPRALVFNVQRCAVHDGPGIRTVVFFKGCPLRCRWCQNPESLAPRPEIAFDAPLCVGCRRCDAACPHGAIGPALERRLDRTRCRRCGTCVAVCPGGAREVVGRWVGLGELLAEVERDRAFFAASGGGLTVSGGEPLLQPAALLALLRAARARGLGTAVETCGEGRGDHFARLLTLADRVYFDVKAIDPGLHRSLTGRDNRRILANLSLAARGPAAVVARVPVVPGLTAARRNLSAIASHLAAGGLPHVELLPYHALGEGKLARLGSARSPLGIAPPDADALDAAAEPFRAAGLEVTVHGR